MVPHIESKSSKVEDNLWSHHQISYWTWEMLESRSNTNFKGDNDGGISKFPKAITRRFDIYQICTGYKMITIVLHLTLRYGVNSPTRRITENERFIPQHGCRKHLQLQVTGNNSSCNTD
ncbi:hypothetical protein AVEN_266152-1 [Araneus ventricosus]|uniref:Uncharacterized protein n=1 Tax=Araneus ventricosus TaxID=182803 RepID=A0A4Y2G1T0_ARAVE|nr:hypothetical protein AVEN_266152-1 [Araneus ventricosus]